MMKKILSLLLATMMICSILTACGGGKTTEPAPEKPTTPATDSNNTADDKDTLEGEIKIGVSAGITGVTPLEGQAMINTITLACDIINNERGGVLGKKLVPVFEDDAYTTDGATNAVNKLAYDDKIVAMIGPHRSNCVVATEAIFADAGIATLTGGSSPTFYDFDHDYIFRTRVSDTYMAQACPQYLLENLGATKIAILYGTDDYGTSAYKVMEEYLKDKGVDYIAEGFNIGDTDMIGQLLKAKDSGCDGLAVWGHGAELAIIARQRKELGITMPTVGSVGFSNAVFTGLADEESADGLYSVGEYTLETDDPTILDFAKRYEEAFGMIPESHAGAYFDCAFLLAEAINRAGTTDREAIKDALKETSGYSGILGEMTCDDVRDMLHGALILKNDGLVPKMVDRLAF